MTTLELIQKAKNELLDAINQNNNVFGKVLSSSEVQRARIGKAIAFLEVAEEQTHIDYENFKSVLQMEENMTEGDHERIADNDKAAAGVVCLPADGE